MKEILRTHDTLSSGGLHIVWHRCVTLEYARENGIKLISKLHPIVSNGAGTAVGGFEFNKDADTFRCPAGQLAVRKAQKGRKNVGRNHVVAYYFDVGKCAACPLREGCYRDGAKFKTYNVTILSETHLEQKEFQETPYFRERARQRYMIEAKNAEMKQAHGLGKADSSGLAAMRLQSYFTAFAVNVKRIVRLLELQTA